MGIVYGEVITFKIEDEDGNMAELKGFDVDWGKSDDTEIADVIEHLGVLSFTGTVVFHFPYPFYELMPPQNDARLS